MTVMSPGSLRACGGVIAGDNGMLFWGQGENVMLICVAILLKGMRLQSTEGKRSSKLQSPNPKP
jgi:hypothetical protein